MLYKTRGIVLSHLKFKESSIILKVFTEEFGLQTYIVNGVRSAKSKGKMAIYQPLTLLDMVVYKNEQKSIQRISECRCEFHFSKIPFDMKKSAVFMFWAELLTKVLTAEGMEDKSKYKFIRDNLVELDNATADIEHYPVHFGIHLCKYIGFEIASSSELVLEFDHDNVKNRPDLVTYLDAHLNQNPLPETSVELRRAALGCLLNFYGNHMEDFREMKSLHVLKQLFN